MEKHCNNCHSNEIEELVWMNQITGDITAREDQYFCNVCRAKVDIILAKPKTSWIEDIEPLDETTTIIDDITVSQKEQSTH
jgi:hypothetical protein